MPEKTPVYYVVNWPYHEHREMPDSKRMRWVKAKVKFDGPAWIKLSKAADPCAVLATWEIVRGLAILSPYRGLLLTDESVPVPYDADLIAEVTRFPQEKVSFGLCFLIETLQWVAACHDYNDFATLSSKLWRKRYTDKGLGRKSPARSERDPGAEPPRLERDSSAPTSHHNTSPSQERTLQSPPTPSIVPLHPTGNGQNGGEGSRVGVKVTGENDDLGTGDWTSDTWELFLKQMPEAWRYYLQQIGRELRQHPRKLVLAHGLDMRFAQKPPQDAREVKEFLLARLSNRWEPSRKHYTRAESLLRRVS